LWDVEFFIPRVPSFVRLSINLHVMSIQLGSAYQSSPIAKGRRDRERERETHQEIPQDPTRAPNQAIRPALDPTLMLVENKDGTALNHAAFPLYQPPSDPGDHPSPCGLEDEEGIVSGLYVPSERGVQSGRGRVGGCLLRCKGGDGTGARGVAGGVRVDDDFLRHGGGGHPRV
jgi:hypothetical protein